ncbi:DUF1295 domain protein [Sodiomyces alkalinus F11]|uniref:DUF1295 domain protein n=1 Tax=Sodiomyces alkalinus (strain CBS 110278 / VKM F-3762 / F11) TaxID=1314773 RepID=A0A3N2PMJ8_SODAK|nr:DUF1295 domain protein [Sodiomyces alkalinus F11]ROT35699.1 DUF1295 domain protein [Sodiomyces alkalinus F11]
MAIPNLSALPAVKTLEECADFSQTVKPFLPQLYELPNKILDNITNPQALLHVYVETNPLIFGFAVSIFLAAVFLVVAELNRNWSQVDRAWSILPNLYIGHLALWARLAGVPSERIEFVLAATTLWSARLTYNYARKGGYSIGSEDYRWVIVRSKVPAWAFFILSVTFIAFIQSILLFALSAGPGYIILLTSYFEPEVNTSDSAYCMIMLALVVSEYISDGQQWAYQEAKRRYLKDAKDAKVPEGYTQADLDRGFITSGMWSYSRHPNFAAEQLIWFVLYQWSCYASRVITSWAFGGIVSLMLIFQGSTWLTERISKGKYSEYKHYQANVAAFMPTTLAPYKPAGPPQPKIIKTSELAEKQSKKQKRSN